MYAPGSQLVQRVLVRGALGPTGPVQLRAPVPAANLEQTKSTEHDPRAVLPVLVTVPLLWGHPRRDVDELQRRPHENLVQLRHDADVDEVRHTYIRTTNHRTHCVRFSSMVVLFGSSVAPVPQDD